MAKKPPYVPESPREILEANRRHLKSKAGEPDMAKAELIPIWKPGKAPGSEAMEQAELGDFTLYAAKTTEAMHKQAPPGAARISWSIASEVSDSIIGGGAAVNMTEAKEYAYLAYQAACGVIKGGDA
jgi:hypothetical protein